MSRYTPAHRAPRPRRGTWTRAARWLRRSARNLLWAAGDRLCARPLTFPAGNWLAELGWKLSGPFRATLTPAPDVMDPAQAPRPADPPRRGDAARCGPGQPQTPGAVNADNGTGTSAGTATPAPAAAATAPGGAAPLSLPALPQGSPGQGQHPAWVITQPPPGTPPCRGDYRPTQPMRAVGPVPVSVVRPYYPAVEARRDSVARWEA